MAAVSQPAVVPDPSLPGRTLAVSVPAQVVPWVCRESIAPRLRRAEDGTLWTESNGSEGCYGGWELRFPVAAPAGAAFAVRIEAEAAGLARGSDELTADAFWHNADGAELDWEPLLLDGIDGGEDGGALRARLAARLRCPAGGAELRLRCGLRWSARGRVRWHGWSVLPVVQPPARSLRLGVASGRAGRWVDQATSAAHYVRQCHLAGEAGVDLVCLPETVLTWGAPRMEPEALPAAAVPVPGAWLEPFQEAARAHRMGICFSVYERAGAAGEVVYNTALLLGRDGALIGTYRKVHLAIAEARRGVAAGHDFPVYDFDGVRVGMAICMDSAAAESARVLAQRGAEVLLMPIMNDFRATPWGHRRGSFHAERWQLIQRAHAFSNHLFVAAARNTTEGSAVVAPWGEILAWNDGHQDVVWADVNVDDRHKHNLGASIPSVLAAMRRPVTYASLADTAAPVGPPSLRG